MHRYEVNLKVCRHIVQYFRRRLYVSSWDFNKVSKFACLRVQQEEIQHGVSS